jgi:hypothetical protein
LSRHRHGRKDLSNKDDNDDDDDDDDNDDDDEEEDSDIDDINVDHHDNTDDDYAKTTMTLITQKTMTMTRYHKYARVGVKVA